MFSAIATPTLEIESSDIIRSITTKMPLIATRSEKRKLFKILGIFFFLTGSNNQFWVYELFMIQKKIRTFSFEIGFTYGARFS